MSSSSQLCTFFLGDWMLAVPVVRVQEVLAYRPMTQVPLAPDTVRGLINLRGQIVMAVELRNRLSLPARPEGQLPMNVVVRTSDGAASLLVDEIGDVLDVKAECFEAIPDTVEEGARAFFEGVYKLENLLVHILDTDRILAF